MCVAAASEAGITWCLRFLSGGILGPGSDLVSALFPPLSLFLSPHQYRRIFMMSQTYIRKFDGKDLTSKINQNVMGVPT